MTATVNAFEALLPYRRMTGFMGSATVQHLLDLAIERIDQIVPARVYNKNIDTFTARPDAQSERALTGVHYFHRTPKGFDGGELRLHALAPAADGTRAFVDIAPACDMFILFPSWVPHEVRRVSCPSGAFADSRFALNCWYRSRR